MTRSTAVLSAVLAATVIAACGGSDADRPDLPPATPLSASGCSPVTYGGEGKPDYLVAAILSLQGPFFDHGVQDSQALKMVLAQRDWRAGDYDVGLQICDETTATSQTADPATCRRHARSLARNASVLVVVGPVLSGCAREMIPILNRARGGPLALVSPSNTYLGLTRSGPGVAEDEPERNFPTGRRSYIRLAPPDDAQAAAAAMVARRRGAKSVFALADGDAYGVGAAQSFGAAARRTGMRVVGTATWSPRARSFEPLAKRVRDASPDVVYLGGYISSNGTRLVKDLRETLGPDVQLIGPDGFNQPGNLVEAAGEAAEDFVITIAVVPNRVLPPEGREFAAEFERRFSSRPCCFAVHAGQAAHMVLDAIEASGGRRDGVLEHLLSAKVRNGLVGDFSIDRHGDTTLNTIGVYRIEDGRLTFEGGVSPPPELLARR